MGRIRKQNSEERFPVSSWSSSGARLLPVGTRDLPWRVTWLTYRSIWLRKQEEDVEKHHHHHHRRLSVQIISKRAGNQRYNQRQEQIASEHPFCSSSFSPFVQFPVPPHLTSSSRFARFPLSLPEDLMVFFLLLPLSLHLTSFLFLHIKTVQSPSRLVQFPLPPHFTSFLFLFLLIGLIERHPTRKHFVFLYAVFSFVSFWLMRQKKTTTTKLCSQEFNHHASTAFHAFIAITAKPLSSEEEVATSFAKLGYTGLLPPSP